MQIVTDSSHDLTPPQMQGLNISVVPLTVTLEGHSYSDLVDTDPDAFYNHLISANNMPTTSLPSPGEFAQVYHRLAESDPDILSIHISGQVSGTIEAARLGARMVPHANITVYDSMTLSCGLGWQVQAAARAAQEGWTLDQILPLLEKIRAATDVFCIVDDLTHLIHGGRISHLLGWLASVLDIKPIIGVEKDNGAFVLKSRSRTLKKALAQTVHLISQQHGAGAALRTQILNTANPSGAEMLHSVVDRAFNCNWMPKGRMDPVLGAHAGPTMLGICYAPESTFANLPWE